MSFHNADSDFLVIGPTGRYNDSTQKIEQNSIILKIERWLSQDQQVGEFNKLKEIPFLQEEGHGTLLLLENRQKASKEN